jgi:hypothetical protein
LTLQKYTIILHLPNVEKKNVRLEIKAAMLKDKVRHFLGENDAVSSRK